jgi:hypothetical protein
VTLKSLKHESPIKEADEQLEVSKEQPSLDKNLETLAVECREVEVGMTYAESSLRLTENMQLKRCRLRLRRLYLHYILTLDSTAPLSARTSLSNYPHHGDVQSAAPWRFLCEDCSDFIFSC